MNGEGEKINVPATSIRALFYTPSRSIGQMVKVSEVADVMRTSENAIRDLVNSGKIPAIRISGTKSGRIRMLTEDVIKYFESQRTSLAGSDTPPAQDEGTDTD